jgi:hypothetical protein
VRGREQGKITVGHYEVCKHQPLMPTVNDSVPTLMYSDKAVFTLSETVCSEGQSCRFAPTTAHMLNSRLRTILALHSPECCMHFSSLLTTPNIITSAFWRFCNSPAPATQYSNFKSVGKLLLHDKRAGKKVCYRAKSPLKTSLCANGFTDAI